MRVVCATSAVCIFFVEVRFYFQLRAPAAEAGDGWLGRSQEDAQSPAAPRFSVFCAGSAFGIIATFAGFKEQRLSLPVFQKKKSQRLQATIVGNPERPACRTYYSGMTERTKKHMDGLCGVSSF